MFISGTLTFPETDWTKLTTPCTLVFVRELVREEDFPKAGPGRVAKRKCIVEQCSHFLNSGTVLGLLSGMSI